MKFFYKIPDRGHGGGLMDIIRSPDGSITFRTSISVTVPAGTSMLEAENLLVDKVNATEASLTGLLLEARDASPRPPEQDVRRFAAKQKRKTRHVETP